MSELTWAGSVLLCPFSGDYTMHLNKVTQFVDPDRPEQNEEIAVRLQFLCETCAGDTSNCFSNLHYLTIRNHDGCTVMEWEGVTK